MKSNPAKYQAKLKEIAARTGIDFVKYRDPLLVEKLGNMLTIQVVRIQRKRAGSGFQDYKIGDQINILEA